MPRSKSFSQHIVGYNVKDTLLISNNKQYAREVRRAYSVGLSTSQLRRIIPKVKEVTAKLISIIESKRTDRPIDFQKLCIELTMDMIGVIALEANLGGLDGSRNICEEIVNAGHLYIKWLKSPFTSAFCNRFPNSRIAQKRMAELDKLKAEWTRLTYEIIERPDPPNGETPIWYNMRTLIDPETNERLPFEQLRCEIATFIVGGTDTTGLSLSWMLGMLATHPKIVDKLLAELKENGLYGPGKREVQFEDLANLRYLSAVIKEGFRTLHVLKNAGLMRILPNDMTINGYRLPKGTMFLYPGNRPMNIDEEWGDADVIRPERWLTDEDLSSKYYVVFGFGPRDCSGQALAWLELRLTLITLLSRYHFSTEKSFSELLDSAVEGTMTECKGGMMLHVTPRNELEGNGV